MGGDIPKRATRIEMSQSPDHLSNGSATTVGNMTETDDDSRTITTGSRLSSALSTYFVKSDNHGSSAEERTDEIATILDSILDPSDMSVGIGEMAMVFRAVSKLHSDLNADPAMRQQDTSWADGRVAEYRIQENVYRQNEKKTAVESKLKAQAAAMQVNQILCTFKDRIKELSEKSLALLGSREDGKGREKESNDNDTDVAG
jgi:hypothetical protein